ncbi:MAG: L-aspartate oxidase [Candidatus Omnitrophica bacterium]|nr:L-aspartate oxidase [Candidatus Omnitrophota bacterium]MCM8806419.1 L-aspartate oxidase [Candidatus Omnitrophota bacterium]
MTPEYLISFDTKKLNEIKVDFLIIGGGLSGFSLAYELRNFDVLIILKDGIEESSSYYSQGGIAVALNENDSPELHKNDTLKVGCYLNDEKAVDILVNEGIERIKEIIEIGFNFDKDNGKLHFTKEGGHSRNRILHSNGDAIGKNLIEFFYKLISNIPNIKIYKNSFLIDLISVENKIIGAIILDETKNKLFLIRARSYILCTGGAGMIFQETTNPSYITGDGIAVAYRRNVELMDLEFYQFHPTTFYVAGAPRFLISESVRGEGGILRNIYGERFMFDYHPSGELAPRDIVSRAIIDQLKKTNSNCVYLDLTHLKKDYIKTRFPQIYNFCKVYGIEPSKNLIPVRPSAHYFMGGIKTDIWGKTNFENLFACGECACTGVHGANRLGSNSLLECLVFSKRIGNKLKETLYPIYNINVSYKFPQKGDVFIDADDLRRSIRSLMWRNVGIERDEESLKSALEKLTEWQKYAFNKEFNNRNGFETLNMLTVAFLMTKSALMRKESRGAHFRKDFPQEDNENWKKHIVVNKNEIKIK